MNASNDSAIRPRQGTGRFPISAQRWVLWSWVVLALGLFSSSSVAQDSDDDSRRIIQLEEEVVEGRIEKPEAFYILQPTNLSYEEVAPQESFIPDLLRTVEQEPF